MLPEGWFSGKGCRDLGSQEETTWVHLGTQPRAEPVVRAAGAAPSHLCNFANPDAPGDVAVIGLGCGLSPGSFKSPSGDSNAPNGCPGENHWSEKEGGLRECREEGEGQGF